MCYDYREVLCRPYLESSHPMLAMAASSTGIAKAKGRLTNRIRASSVRDSGGARLDALERSIGSGFPRRRPRARRRAAREQRGAAAGRRTRRCKTQIPGSLLAATRACHGCRAVHLVGTTGRHCFRADAHFVYHVRFDWLRRWGGLQNYYRTRGACAAPAANEQKHAHLQRHLGCAKARRCVWSMARQRSRRDARNVAEGPALCHAGPPAHLVRVRSPRLTYGPACGAALEQCS